MVILRPEVRTPDDARTLLDIAQIEFERASLANRTAHMRLMTALDQLNAAQVSFDLAQQDADGQAADDPRLTRRRSPSMHT